MELKQRIENLKTELESLNQCFRENNTEGAMRLIPHILSDTHKLVTQLTKDEQAKVANG